MSASPKHQASLLPTIVVVAYARSASLQRLLNALLAADYPDAEIRLHISVDHAANGQVREVAEAFSWPFGEKVVVAQAKHLGLRDHMLRCGDLSQTYGSIVLLEDDLLVAPAFYHYAMAGLSAYAAEDAVAGLSLYAYARAESSGRAFQPLADGQDLWFMRFPSSWGQCWTAAQWTRFRDWLGAQEDRDWEKNLPAYVAAWPDASWKKRFVAYLEETHRYFAFPRFSLSTNFSESGSHSGADGQWQVPLFLGSTQSWQFPALADSRSRYDSWFELEAEALRSWGLELPAGKLVLDLQGQREIGRGPGGDADWVLTRRFTERPEQTWDDSLLPPEANLICDVSGTAMGWVRPDQVLTQPRSQGQRRKPVLLFTAGEDAAWLDQLNRIGAGVPLEVVPLGQDWSAAFRAAQGRWAMVLAPGEVPDAAALASLEEIFAGDEALSLLMGLPADREVRLPACRWSLARMAQAGNAAWQTGFFPGAVAFRLPLLAETGLLDRPVAGRDAVLEALVQRYPLHTVDLPLLRGALPASRLTVRAQEAPGKRLARTLTYPLHAMDIAYLRFLHHEMAEYPDLIRLDSQHRNWYRSRY